MQAGRLAAKGLLRQARDFLWPPRSLISGDRGEGAGPLKPEEFQKIRFLTDPVCNWCGVPLDYDIGPEAECPACIARPPRWDRARAAFVYDEVSRRPVLDLKRAGRRDGLEILAGWMARSGSQLLEEADLIVPVPLHYTRLIKRGFNQSAWLAQAVGKGTGRRVCVDALKRTRRTPSQAGLSNRARRRNVTGAFDVRASRHKLVEGKRILLIDDVLTTGATLNACVRALKRAGARQIDVLVLARVVREVDVTI
ncbi:ComF family protein [Hyphomonas sp. WL0036]|nr:ComF family protein [Hyphomonas sediminis]